jgi:hypothetical protein
MSRYDDRSEGSERRTNPVRVERDDFVDPQKRDVENPWRGSVSGRSHCPL